MRILGRLAVDRTGVEHVNGAVVMYRYGNLRELSRRSHAFTPGSPQHRQLFNDWLMDHDEPVLSEEEWQFLKQI